jgi:hypothetical protein
VFGLRRVGAGQASGLGAAVGEPDDDGVAIGVAAMTWPGVRVGWAKTTEPSRHSLGARARLVALYGSDPSADSCAVWRSPGSTATPRRASVRQWRYSRNKATSPSSRSGSSSSKRCTAAFAALGWRRDSTRHPPPGAGVTWAVGLGLDGASATGRSVCPDVSRRRTITLPEGRCSTTSPPRRRASRTACSFVS